MRNIVFQFTSLVLMLAVGSIPALAQYGGGGGMGGGGGSTSTGVYTAPKSGYGGNGAAIGAGIGAAAAAVGITYWALHRRPDVVGCVQSSGKELMNEKDGRVYTLLPDSEVYLKPGERVALKGKKTEDGGTYRFEPRKLVKDYGACEAVKPSSAKNGQPATTSTAQAWSK
jgi:hypothetical protein